MQCRMHVVDINEAPKFLLRNTTNSSHAVIVEDPEGGGFLVITHLINRVTSYFTCQNPTQSEYEDAELPRIYISTEALDWYPSGQDYAQRKEATMDLSGAVVNGDTIKNDQIWSLKSYILGQG